MENHILSWMIFFPLVGAALVAIVPKNQHNLIRWISAGATALPLALAVKVFIDFDRSATGFQFMERAPWIQAFNIDYFLGIDGISVTMVLLTALLCFICIFASWGIVKGVKG
ncbi:MAG: NADH-quinone oxidoreductase subunit M, partial [Pseudomonadota bacterium]